MVGRLASTDGSVITSHTCDGRYRTWAAVRPGGKHKEGEKAKIFKGRLKTEFPSDERGVEVMGEIPQAPATFAVLDTAYPCMNERQVAMGESTFGGRRELRSGKGIFHVEELQRIALERAGTAREAIAIMGDLAARYGYVDAGEALTVADPREVWHLEILGPGEGRQGAVWAAVRIPDDHVGVAANISRIGRIDPSDPDRCMASANVFSLAKKMKWWNPASGEPFKFWKAYSGRRPFDIREYWIFKTLAPSLKLDFLKAEELPFSIKPDKKVSLKDVFRLFRATYEGTPYALNSGLLVPRPLRIAKDAGLPLAVPAGGEGTMGSLYRERLLEEAFGKGNRVGSLDVCAWAHPWLSRDMQAMLNFLRPGTVAFHRPVAVMFNAYHTVIQCRSWLPDPIGGICWLGFDNPAATPLGPVFAGVTDLPADFKVDDHKKFRTDSASWAFRRASRLACLRWGKNKGLVEKKVLALEDKALSELPAVEKKALGLYDRDPAAARAFLTRYTQGFLDAMTHQYWRFGDELWMEYLYYL